MFCAYSIDHLPIQETGDDSSDQWANPVNIVVVPLIGKDRGTEWTSWIQWTTGVCSTETRLHWKFPVQSVSNLHGENANTQGETDDDWGKTSFRFRVEGDHQNDCDQDESDDEFNENTLEDNEERG